jgi:hypothetical protein
MTYKKIVRESGLRGNFFAKPAFILLKAEAESLKHTGIGI